MLVFDFMVTGPGYNDILIKRIEGTIDLESLKKACEEALKNCKRGILNPNQFYSFSQGRYYILKEIGGSNE